MSLRPGTLADIVGALALFTSLTLFTSFTFAQQTQTPTFRTRTDLVELDVSVLDKDRRPVRGLTKDDFTILEDGKPQPIAIFEPADVPNPEPPPVEWMRDVTPDVTTNEGKATRLWVVAIDDALIPMDPWIMKSSKQIVRDIIDKFGPDDLVSIVFTADSRQAQDFTNDRAKLLTTLDKFAPGLAAWKGPAAGQDPQFWLGSVLTLRNVVDALVQVPHGRKALIWVTPGAPLNSFAWIREEVQLRLKDLTQEVFEIAKRANVPVYPIDPCGLFGLKAYITNGDLSQPDKPEAPWVRAMDYVLMTAANTGGRAVVNTNEFGPGIAKIFQENNSYYVIGYNPTNMRADGTLRRIKVTVNRPGVDVRTKYEYVAPKPGDEAPKSLNAALSRAVAEQVPMRELPLRATVAPLAIPGRGHLAAVAIALGVRQPVPEAAATGRVTVTTELRVTAFTTEGDNKGTQRSTAKVVLRAGAQGDADYEALSRIDLPPGRYRLRLAAYHEAAAKTGTVMVDVVVPDFTKDSASMSGVVIGATPGRPSAPRDLFRDVLPIVPTAQRAFATTDRATALFYVYQLAGRAMFPAQVAIRIVDGHGAELIAGTQTLGIDRFISAQAQINQAPQAPIVGGTKTIPTIGARPTSAEQVTPPLRAAEFQYLLPLDRLPSGPYLLTFEVTIGTMVLRRDVQFQVR